MSLLSLLGGGLELAGKIMKAPGLDSFLAERTQAFAQAFIVDKTGKALVGKKRERQFVEEFKSPLRDKDFAKGIETTSVFFRAALGHVCDVIQHGSDIRSGQVFAAPKDGINEVAKDITEFFLRTFEAFNRLYRSDLLKEFFISEWKSALVAALEGKLSNKMVELTPDFSVLAMDNKFSWGINEREGAYFFYSGGLDSDNAKKQRDNLNTKLAVISDIRGRSDESTVKQCVADYKAALQAISAKKIGSDIAQKPMERRTADRLDWSSLKIQVLRAKWKIPFRA
jgi:hypothetical protein